MVALFLCHMSMLNATSMPSTESDNHGVDQFILVDNLQNPWKRYYSVLSVGWRPFVLCWIVKFYITAKMSHVPYLSRVKSELTLCALRRKKPKGPGSSRMDLLQDLHLALLRCRIHTASLHHFSNFGQYFRGVEADITRFVPPSFICGYFGPNIKNHTNRYRY